MATVKPLAFALDAYGNCENYAFVIGTSQSCSVTQINDYYEKNRLRRELEAGNDKDGKNSLRYAQLLFGEIEQVARTRFGAFGGSENIQYVRQIREFLFDPQIGMPPKEILALSLMLRNYIELEQPREMAIRLRSAARELKNTNAALDRAWKSCRDDARKCGSIPDLRSGTAAVLFAVGVYDDMDVTRFTTPMQAFFDDGFWGVLDVATLGLGLAGLLRNALKNAVRGGASAAGRLGGSGVRGQGSAYARAVGCNSFSGNTKVWVARAAQDVVKVGKAGQTLASRASSVVKGAKAALATIAISSVAIGTPVLAFNEQSKQQEVQPVTATISHGKNQQSVVTLKLETGNGKQEILETTPEHPFAVRVGQDGQIAWVNAIDLTKGQSIARGDGKSGRLISRSVEARDVQLYNLSVKTAHTYFVGEEQWLVHNCSFSKFLDNGAAILAERDANGTLWTAIDVPVSLKGQGVGQSLFGEAYSELGQGVTSIGGKWVGGDNLIEFNRLVASGIAPEQAALSTFTGKQASRLGFSCVSSIVSTGSSGNYTNVTVIFGKC